MKQIYDIIQEIKISSRKNKIEILKREKSNIKLRRILLATYDNREYGINIDHLPDLNNYPCYGYNMGTFGVMINLLFDIENKILSKEQVMDEICLFLVSLDTNSYDEYIFLHILNKNFKCGLGKKTLNKAWPNFIT